MSTEVSIAAGQTAMDADGMSLELLEIGRIERRGQLFDVRWKLCVYVQITTT